MLPQVIAVVAILVYLVVFALTHGFFLGALYGRPRLSKLSAMLWPLGWLGYGAYVVFSYLSNVGYRYGTRASDAMDIIGG